MKIVQRMRRKGLRREEELALDALVLHIILLLPPLLLLHLLLLLLLLLFHVSRGRRTDTPILQSSLGLLSSRRPRSCFTHCPEKSANCLGGDWQFKLKLNCLGGS